MFKSTTKVFTSIKDFPTDLFNKAMDKMSEAVDEAGKAVDKAGKAMDNTDWIVQDASSSNSDEILTDDVRITLRDGEIKIFGEYKCLKVNGRVITQCPD